MKRRNATCGRVIVAVGVCAALFGIGGTVQADAMEAKVRKPVSAHIGWGEARDGLQLGLFPQGIQKTFHYGDTLALVLRARNVSHAPIELTMKQPQIVSVTLGEGGRLVLQTLGGGTMVVPFRLAPGETAELPNGRFAAQIVAVGEKPEPTEEAAPVLALLPGVYHAECSYPIWLPDKDDISRATAHRAKPGNFTFTVQEGARRQSVTRRQGGVPDTSILWGEAVNGVQGGLRRVTAKNMNALPADKRRDIADDELLVQFFVRNTTDKPLALSYHNFDENDASCWVKDAQGKDRSVQATFFTGFRVPSQQTLQSGETMQAGWGRLKFQTQGTAQGGSISTPILTAEAGQYTLRLISSVRFAGRDNLDMVLVSGSIPFTVTP